MTQIKSDNFEIVCIGTFFVGGKKYTGIKLNKPLAEEGWFKYTPKLMAGGVYVTTGTIEDNKIKSISLSGARFKSKIVDKEELAIIMLRHESAESEITAVNQAIKAKKDKSPILDLLLPLRGLYHQTNAVGKLALEVRILNYLRNGYDL